MNMALDSPPAATPAATSAADKRAQVAALLRKRISQPKTVPLSFAQQRLWFFDQFEAGSALYNVFRAFRLVGTLDVTAFEQSLNAIVQRHETLRTTFAVINGQPAQVIAPTLQIELAWHDLQAMSLAERERTARQVATEEAQRPFDLARGPLVRAGLVRLGPETHILLLTMHHIVADDWSLGVLLRELSALYTAHSRGERASLPPLPIQYADFAVWQQQRLESEVLGQQLAYWQQQLADLPALLELPTDHPRPPRQSFRGAHRTFTLPPALSKALSALSQREGVTLFMTLLAVFQLLLARYTGQTDIVVGSPIAGRLRAETEGLIGFFVNTLVLRGNLSGNPTFRELLGRVRQVALGAYDHQEVPFEKLVEVLAPERDLSHSPLFQVALALQRRVSDDLRLDDLQIEPVEVERPTSKFDLMLTLAESPAGIQGLVEYSSDLFEDQTISRMLGHWQTLLAAVVADPDRRIAELPLLTTAEATQILHTWNQTRRDYAPQPSIQQRFEAQVARDPATLALVYEDQPLSYGELNRRANQLAHRLQRLGVGPEVVVGLCLERSVELIVGLLAILKAGGAYLPLDPSFPSERLAFMLADSAAPVLLTQAALVPQLPEGDATVLCLDRDWTSIAQEPEGNLAQPVSPANLVYVIYTSGSTGRPKGVAVAQQQLGNYLDGILERLQPPARASFATVSTVAADLGNTMIFPALCTGGTLHLVAQERLGDPEALASYIAQHQIDCLKIVPSHLAALQATAHPERVLPRRLLVLGGEASPLSWVKQLQSLAPDCRIVNHYGPTETTVGVLTYPVAADELPITSTTLPLGRPIPNTQIYLLDRQLQPVPVGVPGEVYIGGLNVVRGYLRRPDLTAERFLPDPFGATPGARLYRTGDLARALSDGNIEFLGRADHQVKIRGFRVEPEEIAALLAQHPDLQQAYVQALPDQRGETRLVAYVAPRPARATTIEGHMRYRLPNNLAVAQLNKNETDYIYREVFELQAYRRHGITLRPGACVCDVGANIGMFTLFAHQLAPDIRHYAFEPNPTIFKILSANAALYCPEARLFQCGLSSTAREATFTFFPGFSLLSGLYADAEVEKGVVKAFLHNQQAAGEEDLGQLLAEADTLLAERFAEQQFQVQLRTLSEIIAEQGIERIDLLKINVEKSELDVLLGIRDEDWPKIQQLILEVDLQEQVEPIQALLERQGFDWVRAQDPVLRQTELCYIYAVRRGSDYHLIREETPGIHAQPLAPLAEPFLTADELRAFLGAQLPDYMVPTSFVLLERLPVTANGKVDRRALPLPEEAGASGARRFQAPHTPIETLLAMLWAELLRRPPVALDDNFFELGGHSLLATRLIGQVRSSFQVELPVRTIFEAPTLGALAARIQAARQGAQALPAPALRPVGREGPLPLSFAQQRLWFLEQLAPGQPTYHIPVGFRLSGPLDVEALTASLAALVARHEALRTSFVLLDGQPVQQLAPTLAVPLVCHDLWAEGDGPAEREARAQDLLAEAAWRPFDLSQGPLVRAHLVRLAPETHLLQLTLHHLIADGWSLEILLRELAIFYSAARDEVPATLPPLPIQYADVAVWQRQWLQTEGVLERQLGYWRRQLAGAPALLELPTDRPRPPLQTFHGAQQPLTLAPALVEALARVSQREGVTLFMTLLAAFQVLLMRYTRQTDILVGTPIAGRTRAEVVGVVGLFLNTLVFRADLSGNPTFRALLQQVRELALDAYSHQDLPFEQLIEALQPERALSHSPLFQVMFTLQEALPAALAMAGLKSEPLTMAASIAKFDLSLALVESDGQLSGTLSYNTDLFDERTIVRLADHWQQLLASIVAEPEARIGNLPLLSQAEQAQLLGGWHPPRQPVAAQTLPQLFEAQVERTPQAPALLAGDQTLTYRELNQRANQLAHTLRSRGVGSEQPVAILLERTPGLLIALLGVLKAGAAYLPLDPTTPPARLAWMLADARAPLLVTESSVGAAFPELALPMLCLDQEAGTLTGVPDHPPPSGAAELEQLAYVIYTSGSTGQPKGVGVSHGALSNFVQGIAPVVGLGAGDRLVAVTTVAFDIAALELLLPLTVGATVVLASRAVASDGAALAGLLTASQATVMQATPATWRLLLAAGWRGHPDFTLLCGGEALPLPLARQLLPCGQALWNLYGPTEATIWASAQQITPTDPVISLGRPLPNLELYLLDAALQPVPTGVPGELFLGGAGLARGYLNRPDLTAERFIPHPFSDTPGARLYRTGDLVRARSDGSIEFLGRTDQQVKIRGFRIELGEIEAALSQHPAVREAVALVRNEPQTEPQLVAYLLLAGNEAPAPSVLRDFLAQRLPDYMLPAAFVALREWPLTPNGKLDRRALPAPAGDARLRETSYTPPSTPPQGQLAELWAELLRLERVGIHDNFFALGGHSLLATQLLARISQQFRVTLPLRVIFERPTIAALAEALGQAGPPSTLTPHPPALTRVARDRHRAKLSKAGTLDTTEV
jgi:amino acid adenylation domain-containing protein/FkbM family methyltransferase